MGLSRQVLIKIPLLMTLLLLCFMFYAYFEHSVIMNHKKVPSLPSHKLCKGQHQSGIYHWVINHCEKLHDLMVALQVHYNQPRLCQIVLLRKLRDISPLLTLVCLNSLQSGNGAQGEQ